VHEAFLVETEVLTTQPEAGPRPRPSELETKTRPGEAYQLRGETEPRHYCTSRWPRDRGVKAKATSHIHLIPRTDVVQKRSGESLELRLNRSGIFKQNFIYVMLNRLPTRPRRLYRGQDQGLEYRDRGQDLDVQSRGRGETEAFEISSEARPSQGTAAPRDSLETEASRPRPHPCSVDNLYHFVVGYKIT